MAKQGQHKHDIHDHRLMPATGHTNPRKTTPNTTGTYKRRKRHAEPAGEQQQPAKRTPRRAVKWHPDTRQFVTHEADSEARADDRPTRSGSDSNADAGTRGY
ncbi:MAG TPA: hypothetical protein VFU63_05080 [Ktedonobacterales bacterium]|nr:hypothetical protein [Ktedonobacterales bacterium]